jgi:FkbM family methyltransferase
MTAATGNVYVGLYECADMAFLLHVLRPDDLFVDIGANIGSYTVLASKVCGARSMAVEPCESTISALRRNITANQIEALVDQAPVALGAADGEAVFSEDLGTMNRVLEANSRGRVVPLRTLDSLLEGRAPTLIKADVEGYEEQVLMGSARTLRHPSLLAIELETVSQISAEILEQSGFERVSYSPFDRTIGAPGAFPMSNALFVRDRKEVMSRVRAAPVRTVHGVRI